VALITLLNEIYFVVSHDTDIPAVERIAIRNLITSTNESVNILFNVRLPCVRLCVFVVPSFGNAGLVV
jgi:hypothetical protein